MILTWRIVRAGLIAALAVGLAGWAYERVRFGASDRDSLARAEAELRQRFDASADTLGEIAGRVKGDLDAIRLAPRDATAARRLFAAVDAALPAAEAGRTGLTVYGASATPLAWAGRVSELPKERLDGPAALFVIPGAPGLRLVRVEPVLGVDAGDRKPTPRLGVIVVEQVLGPIRGALVPADSFVVPTSIVPVSIPARSRDAGGDDGGGPVFTIAARTGEPLVDAEIASGAFAEARSAWRRSTWAAVWSILAVMLLCLIRPLVERRRQAAGPAAFVVATAGLVLVLTCARLILWLAIGPLVEPRTQASPVDLLLHALLVAALVWVALDLIERWRLVRPRRGLVRDDLQSLGWLALGFAGAGAAGVLLLAMYEGFLRLVVSSTEIDLLHFSLHPISAVRLAIAFALVLLHASVIWTVAGLTRLPGLVRRIPRSWLPQSVAAAGWMAGLALTAILLQRRAQVFPITPTLVAAAMAGGSAWVVARLRGQARHASQAARLGALFLALLVPAVAMYPSLLALATSAKEGLLASNYGPQAANQREELRARLYTALDQIDAATSLPQNVASALPVATPTTERAFAVWSRTDLAEHRLTSAVELYSSGGMLVSRFALNLPESPTNIQLPQGCDWDLFDEASPFGSSVRHVLRASRGLCVSGHPVGAVVVRVMLDYRTLPFISSPNPYLGSLRPVAQTPAESAQDRDVEFVVYGWSGAAIYSSGPSVWAIPDPVFRSLVESRRPFWDTLQRGDARYRVYFLNDRSGIYALGYPVITWFGHLVNLAELATLAGVLYLLLLGAATLLSALTLRTASGRALLREIRSSFYRKLFLAFVAAAVVPVVVLAFATRTYLANQLRDSVEEAAARTVTVAQRLVEDYATLQQRGAAVLQGLDDELMVLVGRAIDQDVNLFDRAQLQATSEPDLFASGLLTKRTPGDVYRNIVLDRLPTFVGVEDVGDFQYLLAAAPVRAGGREGIVTVPLTPRQQEIESQIDELDRRVLFATVLFSLLGAAIGYWMAERIADPVNRLTRATRRIARGDLDARIAATSSDELRRLVEDFNRMAADLKRQRADLERSQRLEAWADMARQVAHDIKNPLTPIQLSAEHARRVNVDRGRPLSPVLDECVAAILTQVRLLRQISAEFSSFASSPTPRPEPTRLGELIEEVVQPYRAPLAGRIDTIVEVAENLPAVVVDRTLFARALTNVIENALHAMPAGGQLRIVGRASPVGDGRRSVVVTVTDTGVGMDRESLARIFEPYFSTKATGTGLGLTIAKRNVELNGGRIEVQSERGAGTTVTITLPAAAETFASIA